MHYYLNTNIMPEDEKVKMSVATKTKTVETIPEVKGVEVSKGEVPRRKVKTRRDAKTTTYGSKNLEAEKKKLAKEGGAYVTSEEYYPITQRTYVLETKRKGSSKGYKIVAGKHFKARTIVK